MVYTYKEQIKEEWCTLIKNKSKKNGVHLQRKEQIK